MLGITAISGPQTRIQTPQNHKTKKEGKTIYRGFAIPRDLRSNRNYADMFGWHENYKQNFGLTYET